MTDDTIDIKLTETNFLTRWHCHVCGGHTEKVPVLAEGELLLPTGHSHGEGYDCYTVRVCEQCLQAGEIDARLERTARQIEANADFTRALIGKLRVPSYAEWNAAVEAHWAAIEREYRESEQLPVLRVVNHDDSVPF